MITNRCELSRPPGRKLDVWVPPAFVDLKAWAAGPNHSLDKVLN